MYFYYVAFGKFVDKGSVFFFFKEHEGKSDEGGVFIYKDNLGKLNKKGECVSKEGKWK